MLNHDVDVSKKPRLIYISKSDSLINNEDANEFLKKYNTISFSSITGDNIDIVVKQIAKEIEKINNSQKRETSPEPNKGSWSFPDKTDM